MAEGCQGRSARRGVTGVSTLRTKGEGALGKPNRNLHLKNGFIKKTCVLATTLTSFYQLNLTFVFVYTTSIKRGEFGTPPPSKSSKFCQKKTKATLFLIQFSTLTRKRKAGVRQAHCSRSVTTVGWDGQSQDGKYRFPDVDLPSGDYKGNLSAIFFPMNCHFKISFNSCISTNLRETKYLRTNGPTDNSDK